jgi:carbonic anhydrase
MSPPEDESALPAGPSHNNLREVLDANRAYVESFGDKASLVGAPRRRMAILTCMDARMDPAAFSGVREGDAHVIRNAGGRASDDAIRSLVVSCKLMGTTDWFVIHHSGCGMQAYTDDDIRHLLGLDDNDAAHHGTKWWHVRKSARTPGAEIQWLTFHDLTRSIVEDVQRIREHPLVPRSVAIYGFIYHIHHGSLEAVPEANRIGAPAGSPP